MSRNGSCVGSCDDGRSGSSGPQAAREVLLATIHGDLFLRKDRETKQGNVGQSINCVSNFIPIDCRDGTRFSQYHVKFEPSIDNKLVRLEILKNLSHIIGTEYFLFDGMILYSPCEIGKETIHSHPHPTLEGASVKVMIKQTASFGLDDPQAINVYNLLIRRTFLEIGYRQLGRHWFNPELAHRIPHLSLEIWPGYETSIRMHENQLLLNIENKHKVLRDETAWNVMQKQALRYRDNVDAYRKAVETLICNQTVLTTYNNKMHRVTSIAWDESPLTTFVRDDEPITYRRYYMEQYGCDVATDKQPLLISEAKSKAPGQSAQVTYLVPTLCNLTGLTQEMRDDQRTMRELSDFARLNPARRHQSTMDYLQKIHESDRASKILDAWGLTFVSELVNAEARRLAPETMIGDEKCRGFNGGPQSEWSAHLKSSGMSSVKKLDTWVLMAPGDDLGRKLGSAFNEEMRKLAATLRMEVAPPLCMPVRGHEPKHYEQGIDDALEQAQRHNRTIQLIVAILKDDDKNRYDTVKRRLCIKTPIPSQCVRYGTLEGSKRTRTERGLNKNFSSIVLKVILQINCKLGGALWRVNIPLRDTMIVGYNMYNDSTLQGLTIGACVSSTDAKFTRWYSQTLPHRNPVEIGNNVFTFMLRALESYYMANDNKLPGTIIFYRDGCGDGQIPHIKNEELPQVLNAFVEVGRMLNVDYNPKLSYTIVTRRTNTRIFAQQGNSLVNPAPGTIVDRVVTRPERWDFFMVPQFVNQGTVTPVAYNVIHDSTELTANHHHQLAFKLCHLYYNWQGTVRVPAPCQYAHKLAHLVSQSLHQTVHKDLNDKLFFL